jgi:copper oxidase (laccase) domain-containing protein
MNPNFKIVDVNELQVLVYRPWWDAGLVHGMTTRALNATKENFPESMERLCAALEVDKIYLPVQSHSNVVVDACSVDQMQGLRAAASGLVQQVPGDGVVAPVKQPSPDERHAYGIVTADCVPIFVRGSENYVLIHAGWRGLANGVIRNGVRDLKIASEAEIFAAAGSSRYEVGEEVIEAIGPTAVFCPLANRPGFYRLDTVQTAINQLREVHPGLPISSSDICTISDLRFHSFRRDGELAGRGVTFVVLS